MARILFLQNMPFEYMGPMYLSAYVKQHGHDCRLFVVVVGVEIFDALGQYGFDFTIVSFCEDSCLAALIKPGFAEAGVPFVPELFIVGTADADTLSYFWFVDFVEQGNTVNFSDERVPAPQVVVAQPGFVALAVEVSDTAGSSTVAYGAFDVFVEGFDELFAELSASFSFS